MRPVLVLLLAAACSDSPPSSTSVDAPTGGMDAYDSARCLIKGDYGAVGSLTGNPSMGANTLSATLDAGPPRDSFFLKLTAGKGVFASGVATGTFTISGVDAGYLTCGLCVHIIADIAAGTGPTKFYFADSGTVTLTSTAPIMGSATNLHFTTVDINSGNKIADGCDATMASISFANP